jgi:hypothetical protein
MASFDLEKAAKILGSKGGNLTDAIGMGFGAPQCIIEMTKDLLKILPSELLGDLSQTLDQARTAAMDSTVWLTEKIFKENGLIQFDTQTGKWKFVGDSSLFGSDTISAKTLENLGGILGAAAYAVAFGSQLYNNYTVAQEQIGGILNCVDQFKNFLAGSKGSSALAASLQLGEAGSCDCAGVSLPTGVDCADLTQPQACKAVGATWVADDPEGYKKCYGADADNENDCVNAVPPGVWTTPIEPLGGVGSFGPSQGRDPEVQFAIARNQLQEALDFAEACDVQLAVIGSIMRDRQLDPTLEPVFMTGEGGVTDLVFSGTTLRRATASNWERLLSGDIQVDLDKTTPDGEINPNYGKFIEDGAEVFRLVYGPPKAKKGQFILTIDGLYYDSQRGGVPDVPLKFLPTIGKKYLNEYAPNLGGKGTLIGDKELDIFMNTLFDINNISDSDTLQPYYNADEFLQQLIGEKNKHINDLNKGLNTAIFDASSTAIIHNMRQTIFSQAAKHQAKINKRKKQIEVAVVTPGTFGSPPFEDGEKDALIGNIPINDFTFLKDFNVIVSLEQQKNLTFTQADVTNVILPLKPKFVSASGTEAGLVADHLMIPTIGAEGIFFDSSSAGDQQVSLLSLTDEITTEGLISVYNFLEATIETPTSPPFASTSKWGVLNTYSSDSIKDPNNPIILGNAKLLSEEASSVFVSGLSMPKLTGLVRYNEAGDEITLGNAVRLPETKKFNDLFYNSSGVSMEFWVHMPGIETSSTSNVEPDGEWGPNTYNRILLGSENCGGLDENNLQDIAENTFGSDHVRGFLMGFSRDKQILNDEAPSNTNNDNPSEDMCFFAAPTLSYNSSGVSFISTEQSFCLSGYDVHKFKVDTDVVGSHGKSFGDVSGEFMHIVYTVDPSSNSMSVYLDGEEMASSGLDAFGVQTPYGYLALPTGKFPKDSALGDALPDSFEYNSNSTNNTTVTPTNSVFYNGPQLDTTFTPWILGGGYTDGFLTWEGEDNSGDAGGFMNKYHGKTSGLNGFVGSVKFYSKALNTKEVNSNYNAQQSYFKNIDL